MKIFLIFLVMVFFIISPSLATSSEVYENIPDGCEVVESFTLISASPSLKKRVAELAKGTSFKFDGVIFSTDLYEKRKKVENEQFQKWLSEQDPNLVVEPNFYGVPVGSNIFKGVLIKCAGR